METDGTIARNLNALVILNLFCTSVILLSQPDYSGSLTIVYTELS